MKAAEKALEGRTGKCTYSWSPCVDWIVGDGRSCA